MHPARLSILTGALAFAAAASLTPIPAEAFCGFYVSGAEGKLFNNATQVVMMREGTRTVLSMQNNYQGPPSDFAMVIPVPVILSEESVKTLPASVFDDVDRMASPRLVEYWEMDPCEPEYRYYDKMVSVADEGGGGWDEESEPEEEDLGVKVEAEFTVGEYDILILSAKESNGLDKWLRQNKYNIPEGAAGVLAPYVEQGLFFFVAKVDVKKVTFDQGQAMLSPLRFHYDTDNFSLPIRLGMLNANGPQDLIVHILARNQRYQAANARNVTIPTNIGVSDEVRTRFGEFYAALFDRTLAKTPGAVVTEYSWDASSCDPCPGPTLMPEHFATLGADVLPNPDPWGFVLTRMHTRYTKESLGEDLIFAAAPPIVGGREVMGATGELEEGAQASGINNFQGRYIIRHPWTGPVECEAPIRGRWGGPPDGSWPEGSGDGGVKAAQGVAFAPRGKIELASMITTPIPALDLSASELEAVENTEPRPVVLPPGGVNEGGCASCSAVEGGRGVAPWLLLVALGGLWLGRRRRWSTSLW